MTHHPAVVIGAAHAYRQRDYVGRRRETDLVALVNGSSHDVVKVGLVAMPMDRQHVGMALNAVTALAAANVWVVKNVPPFALAAVVEYAALVDPLHWDHPPCRHRDHLPHHHLASFAAAVAVVVAQHLTCHPFAVAALVASDLVASLLLRPRIDHLVHQDRSYHRQTVVRHHHPFVAAHVVVADKGAGSWALAFDAL